MADDFRFDESCYILVGKVNKAHGLRGEVKATFYSGDPQSPMQYQQVLLVDRRGEISPLLVVEKARWQGHAAILKLDRVNDRSMAEAVQDMGILVSREDLPDLPEDEYYWHQLHDLPVITEDGKELGRVTSIFSNGAHDIMVVGDGAAEYLIPVIETIIREQRKECVVIAPPPGLLEMNSGDTE